VVTTAAAPARYTRIPRYRFGPKPKRRTELGLLVFGWVIITALYILASLGQTSKIPPHIGPFLAVLFILTVVLHLANRWLVPNAHPILLPVVVLLNGIGYVVIARYDPSIASAQAGWTAISVFFYVGTLLLVRRTRDLDRYRYLLLLVAALLVLSPLVPPFGNNLANSGGVRLWVKIGSVEFQPVEIAKILLCIFFASYFAEKKELLSIPTARLGNRLVLDPRPLIPILAAFGFAMLVIAKEYDIGFALLIFTLFIVLLWITTGRIAYIVFGLLLFAVGAFVAAHLFSQFHERVTLWLDPWSYTSSQPVCQATLRPTACLGGDQLADGWYAMGLGGVGGVGLGLGQACYVTGCTGLFIYALTSDMIFAAIGYQLGLMGTAVVTLAFLLLVGTGLRIAQTARSDFARLVAVGLTTLIGFQSFFIMAGVTRLLPLTGITLPFMAYGGSSLITNYVLIALLMRISEEGTATPAERSSGTPQPGERAFTQAN